MIKKIIIFGLGAYLAIKGFEYLDDWTKPIKDYSTQEQHTQSGF